MKKNSDKKCSNKEKKKENPGKNVFLKKNFHSIKKYFGKNSIQLV